MKGFGIYIKNDLLEAKHIENMGIAVWLYMWLIDKMTSISEEGIGKILGGKPIKFEELKDELGISRRTYVRWIEILESHKYINVTQAPYGLIISVNKAKKTFNQRSDKNDTTDKKTGVPEMTHLLTNNGASLTKNGASNKTIQLDNTEDKTILTTNVVNTQSVSPYGNQDINICHIYFLERMKIPKEDCTQSQSRQYWFLLLRESKTGVPGVKWLIDQASENTFYAQHITSSKDLYYKRIKILQQKAHHAKKFAVMKGSAEDEQTGMAIENIRGNPVLDNESKKILPFGN